MGSSQLPVCLARSDRQGLGLGSRPGQTCEAAAVASVVVVVADETAGGGFGERGGYRSR